jgi:hypothetical protein
MVRRTASSKATNHPQASGRNAGSDSREGKPAHPRIFPRTKKPLGLPTRGKTAPNRLRRTDVFLALCYPDWIRHLPGLYIDLGFGEEPATTVETAFRLRRLNPALGILGVEIDPARVAAALPFSGPELEFRLGGFNLPLQDGEGAAVIRAMNVLRQYPESEYPASIRLLGQYLPQNGLLLEGTSDPPGRLMAFNLYRRSGAGLSYDGLVFSVRLRHPFQPRDLQAVLPKNLIHHVEQGSPMDRFFADWDLAWQRARRSFASDPRLRLEQSIRYLAGACGYPIDLRAAVLRRGFIRLRAIPPSGPDPSPAMQNLAANLS